MRRQTGPAAEGILKVARRDHGELQENLHAARIWTVRRVAVAWAIILASLAFAVAPAAAQDGLEPFANSSRLVTIGGSLTEIVYALGEENRLVARDSTSIYPPAATELPDVGYMRALSPEGVLSVDPSAILALEDSGPPEAIAVLEKASVPMVMVPETYDRKGILHKIAIVGAALGVQKKAEKLAARLDAEIRAAETQAAGVAVPKRVLFILSMQGGRILGSGDGTAADGIIRMAGGVNAITGFSGYKQLTDEAVIEARPDVVLMMERAGAPAVSAEELFAHPALAATPAAEDSALITMDGAYLLGFGPRTAAAIRDLSAALYGPAVAN